MLRSVKIKSIFGQFYYQKLCCCTNFQVLENYIQVTHLLEGNFIYFRLYVVNVNNFTPIDKARIEIKTSFIFFLFSPVSEFFEQWISAITTVWYTNRYLIFFKIILNLLLLWKVHWGHKTREIPMQTVHWHYRWTKNNFKNLRHCFGTTRLLFVKSRNIWFLCKRNGQSAVTSSFFVSPIPLH